MGIVTLLFVISLAISFNAAWTTPVSADLAWPPLDNEVFITMNRQVIKMDPAFPCGQFPLNASIPRFDFPVDNIRYQVNLGNSSGVLPTYQFIIDSFFGQLSFDPSPDQSGWMYATTDVFDDFSTGPACSGSINATLSMQSSLAFGDKNYNLIGANATLGLRVILFDEDNNVEEMNQCSYIRFVASNAPVTQNRGVCNTGGSLSSTPIPVPTPTSTSTSGSTSPVSSATSTASTSSALASPTLPPNTTNDDDHYKALGQSIAHLLIGVGVAVAFLICLCIFCCYRRRKKSRSPKPEESPDIECVDYKVVEKEKTKFDDEKEPSSVRSSAFSEQLPSYESVFHDTASGNNGKLGKEDCKEDLKADPKSIDTDDTEWSMEKPGSSSERGVDAKHGS